MAAVSNAGKVRSNREEQQKYFTLSSALQLVCDELTQAEYTAKYEVATTEVYTTDADGNSVLAYTYKSFTQGSGDFSCGLNDVLPLRSELDYLSSELFSKTTGGGTGQGDDIYKPLSGTSVPEEHTLTLTVQADDGSGLATPVDISVWLGHGATDEYRIYLKAVLKDTSAPKYVMYAELINNNKPSISASSDGLHDCTPAIQWTVGQITKKPSSNSPFQEGGSAP